MDILPIWKGKPVISPKPFPIRRNESVSLYFLPPFVEALRLAHQIAGFSCFMSLGKKGISTLF
ncbi:MAG: hypothetical protein COB85_07845, partial [Bacteroidetes bacterium]